ncbi:hypothetical protein PWYN_25740 [Paenibacillus wynnii]|uniref:Uncharacterized protein n=1 Tax=Paenibacillus wynnii TaxID=268407 RepID=A0A098M5W4_9BACL|nr:hypothetical protein PWYN_25740 [Paenibacillus wynnii]
MCSQIQQKEDIFPEGVMLLFECDEALNPKWLVLQWPQFIAGLFFMEINHCPMLSIICKEKFRR